MIEDYALIGNRGAAALVSRTGSIDWLCIPRFDTPASFAALLGSPQNGRWLIAPVHSECATHRQYREKTAVLESTFSNSEGTVVLTDGMDRRSGQQSVLRLLKCTSGRVSMRFALLLTSDFGLILPRFENVSERRCQAINGPHRFNIEADVPFRVTDSGEVCAEFVIEAGQELAFSLTWSHFYLPDPVRPNVSARIADLTEFWTEWSKRFQSKGDWAEAELRSLITIQLLTDSQSGSFVGAPTTSLPENPGGNKNWDYRYCWLRDGAFSLRAFIDGGFKEEAQAWRAWLLRVVAGSPDKMQIMYGVHGERNLHERELSWLSGYQHSRPVREGNAASAQFQLDIFGQVLDMFFQSRIAGIDSPESWPLEKQLIEQTMRRWRNPGAGIWELRKEQHQFTESKAMAWVALDRGIKTAEKFGMKAPVDHWQQVRTEIHDEVCRAGFNPHLNSFVQYYGGDSLDASLLLLPLFDFLPPDDPRIQGTVAAIEKSLLRDGLVIRYRNYGNAAKPEAQEGVFLACSFWLVDNYVLQGRMEEARELFERLLGLRNDVGLLSEEYDTSNHQLIGNYPQALSHAALITSIHNLNLARDKQNRGS